VSRLNPAVGLVNASASNLDNLSNAPFVRDVLTGWFQKLTLAKVVKELVDYEVKEVIKPLVSSGMVQPLSGRRLEMKPEGERSWDWQLVHATPDLVLSTDDVIIFCGTRYRITSQKPYAAYGFIEYEMVNDYVRNH
jgi:hypothetical protein